MKEHYEQLMASVYGGKRWILAMDVLAPMRGLVERLEEFGAEGALCVAAAPGTGDPPDPEFAPDPIVFDIRGEDMMSGIRASMRQLAELPADAVARIDAFDPEGNVRVLGTIFDDGTPVGGRAKYGARPEAWQALEDKTRIDAIWDAVGVARSESRVVDSADRQAREAAAEELDEGAGTVWVADNREGFHGGASYTRYVRTPEEAAEVGEYLAAHADRIRIMPFLEGLPCSIHGIVFPDYTVALRPCEMLVYRRAGGTEFHYGKAATFWDPRTEDRESMRLLTRRVGDHLRETLQYRGAFTIDGIMTAEGFRPTELNPRYGAALGNVAGASKIPLLFANLALVEGEDLDWRPRELERVLLETADANRSGGTMAVVKRRLDEQIEAEVVFEGDKVRRAGAEEPPDAKLSAGPHPAGGILFASFVSERTPVGPSVAERGASLLAWADEAWNLGIGELIPARDVRS